MSRLILNLWHDDGGALISLEWLLLALLLVFGIITGLVAVRQSLISELHEASQAINSLDQSFSFSGQSNCESSTAGSSGSDPSGRVVAKSVSPSQSSINQAPCD
jgi:hypothetical protein